MREKMVSRVKAETKHILFSDIHGFSSIPDSSVSRFVEAVLDPVSKMLEEHRSRVGVEVNTWGDAIFALFDDPLHCCRFAIQLRDLFKRDLRYEGLPESLGIRVALHSGIVYRFEDKLRRIPGALGQSITMAARVEPVTPVGSIWATEQLKAAVEGTGNKEVVFCAVGEKDLAKKFGSKKLFAALRPEEVGTWRKHRGAAVKRDPAAEGDTELHDSLVKAEMHALYQNLESKLEDGQAREMVRKLYELGFKRRAR